MADLARSAILISVGLMPILADRLGGVHAATTAVPAEALVTKASFGRYRLRLWHGSIRLNVDELPLITKDRYTLKVGGGNLSHYTWRGLKTKRGVDSFRWQSPDRGGQLVRQLAFHEDGFELRFRLTLKH